MLEILKNSNEFKAACERAAALSKEDECSKFVAYIAKNNQFKVSDWFDDATVARVDLDDVTMI